MANSVEKKGTVTAVGSLFSPEEAEKASRHVHEAISDRWSQLDRLRGFAADNSNLIKLVRHLPDQIDHQIMVPFGSAAFFPGQLIHTNEFLVLLGDGYYAERTSKQTVDILKRREKTLEAQMEALKASMADLETEAKFFDSTAAEAKEGIVEIREEYVEEPQTNEAESGVSGLSSASSSTVDKSNMPDKEDEYARIMARLDELEKEEFEAGSDADEDEDAEDSSIEAVDEVENEGLESDEDEDAPMDFGFSKNYINNDVNTSEKHKSKEKEQKSKAQETVHSTAATVTAGSSHKHLPFQSSILGLNSQFKAGDDSSKSSMKQPHSRHDPPLPPDARIDPRSFSVVKSNMGQTHNTRKPPLPPDSKESSENIANQSGNFGSLTPKAFTGSVIEHSHGLPSNQSTRSTTSDQSQKPVSRFKMQKGNR